jgi:biotin carboxyl carrier protein
MKLFAELDKSKHEINIRRDGEKVFARIDDREYELEASQPEPDVFLLRHKNRIYEFFISPNSRAGEPLQVASRTLSYEVKLTDPKRLRGSAASAGQTDGIVEIRTQMPGKVVRVYVKAGDAVNEGDGVLVVEAMKMQNEMKSPKAGTVKAIHFAEGATVNSGDVLAIIE